MLVRFWRLCSLSVGGEYAQTSDFKSSIAGRATGPNAYVKHMLSAARDRELASVRSVRGRKGLKRLSLEQTRKRVASNVHVSCPT